MKKIIILFILLLSCSGLIACQDLKTDPNEKSIDQELLLSIQSIQNSLNRLSELNKNDGIVALSTKTISVEDSILFLDQERLDILKQHYSLLERIVLDGYISGTQIEAFSYVTEEDSFFYSEYLQSLVIKITKIDDKLQSHIKSENRLDEDNWVINNQIIGEIVDDKLLIKRMESSQGNYTYEEFVENKGMLTLVYEPLNSDNIHIENIFLVPYNETTQMVVFYLLTIEKIIEIQLKQLIFDEMGNLIHDIGSYDSLDYTLQKFDHIEIINAKWNNQEITIDEMNYSIASLLEWHSILKYSSFENLTHYIKLDERVIPVLNIDLIKQRIPEDQYQEFLTLETEYLSLINKEEASVNDIIRTLEIAYTFYSRLDLLQDEITLTSGLYPVIDIEKLQEEINDEYGVSTSIYYTDNLSDSSNSLSEMDLVIRQNHTYVTTNIDALVDEFGSFDEIDLNDMTPEVFLNYLESLGFTVS